MVYTAEVRGTKLSILSEESKCVYENNYQGEILQSYDFRKINEFPIIEEPGKFLYVRIGCIFLMLPMKG